LKHSAKTSAEKIAFGKSMLSLPNNSPPKVL
jgi:hypothetical protein